MRLKDYLELIESDEREHGNIRVVVEDPDALARAVDEASDKFDPHLHAEMIAANGSEKKFTLKYNKSSRTFMWVKTR